jgi:hypothetical protein
MGQNLVILFRLIKVGVFIYTWLVCTYLSPSFLAKFYPGLPWYFDRIQKFKVNLAYNLPG